MWYDDITSVCYDDNHFVLRSLFIYFFNRMWAGGVWLQCSPVHVRLHRSEWRNSWNRVWRLRWVPFTPTGQNSVHRCRSVQPRRAQMCPVRLFFSFLFFFLYVFLLAFFLFSFFLSCLSSFHSVFFRILSFFFYSVFLDFHITSFHSFFPFFNLFLFLFSFLSSSHSACHSINIPPLVSFETTTPPSRSYNFP